MKLSIIVPVYNMADGGKLEYCLDSLVRQDLTEDYEIIAVDDKSSDGSLEILQSYEKRYQGKVKVIASPENRRQGGAKNLGLHAAAGEWVGFVDSDDWAALDMFSKLLERAAQTGADVVGCDYLCTDKTGRETGEKVVNNLPQQTGILDDARYRSLILRPGSMVVKIYKRSLFMEHGLEFPEKMFYEDNAIGVLPLLYAKRFERVEESLYFYWQHEASTVHTVDRSRCEDRIKAMEIYLRECRERQFYDKYKEEIEYKVFELGYRNTLFSYLQGVRRTDYQFIVKMKKFLQDNVPDFLDNSYYVKNMDEENRRLISLHMKNPAVFLAYYKLLAFYRRMRYGDR